jgi:hypothetical protein
MTITMPVGTSADSCGDSFSRVTYVDAIGESGIRGVVSLRKAAAGSARAQHLIARNGIAERRPKKYVRREVSTCSYARKADGRGETIRDPRHPATPLIASSNDRGYGKNAGGMPGWKAAAHQRRFTATKEGVGKRRSGRNVGRPFSAGNCLQGKMRKPIH